MKATKDELRKEITELRHVGKQMANLCFNLCQDENQKRGAQDMKSLYRQWDAIKRAEVKL
jgi:hypothetical protein